MGGVVFEASESRLSAEQVLDHVKFELVAVFDFEHSPVARVLAGAWNGHVATCRVDAEVPGVFRSGALPDEEGKVLKLDGIAPDPISEADLEGAVGLVAMSPTFEDVVGDGKGGIGTEDPLEGLPRSGVRDRRIVEEAESTRRRDRRKVSHPSRAPASRNGSTVPNCRWTVGRVRRGRHDAPSTGRRHR